MARLSWSSSTIAVTARFSSSGTISLTRAGDSDRSIIVIGSGLNGTMSIFSPASSRVTACTRLPFIPTQDPTGSMRSSLLSTAILLRVPGSRATALISTMPSSISGTSAANKARRKPGWVRLRITWGPRLLFWTSTMKALTGFPWWKFSPRIRSRNGSMASTLPRVT